MMKRCCDFALAHVALAWVAWAVAVSAASAAPAGRPGENLARGKTYTLFPRPNYKHCTDPGDATQLTDGQTTDDYFWTQRGTVGWQSARYITVTVDLGRVEPIAGVSFCTAAGTAGVRWPGAIRVLTSDDGKGYRDAGELVALDRKSHGPWPEGYAIRRLITYELQTRGRFVRFLVLPESGSPYTFVDEVEVFPGPAAWLQGRPGGTPVGDAEGLFASWRVRSGVRRRFEADTAAVEKAIRDAQLADESVRSRLLKRLGEAAGALRASSVPAGESFRAVLPYNDAHADLFKVQAALWRAQGRPDLVYWVPPTWDPLDPFVAPPKSSGGRIEVHLMRGERRAAVLNLANTTERPVGVRVRIDGPGGSAVYCVRVGATQWTDTVRGRPVAAAIHGAPYEEHSGGEDPDRQDPVFIRVPPGLVRQVWFDCGVPGPRAGRARQVPTGEHWDTVLVKSEGIADLRIPIRLKVYPLDFPDRTTLLLGGWSYTNGEGRYGVTPQNRKALVEHLRRHLVNCPWATSSVMTQFTFSDDAVQLDTNEFDQWIAEWPDAERYMVFLSAGRSFAGEEMGTPQFDRRVGAWISAWTGHLQSKAIAPERLGLLLRDEPHEGSDIRPLLAWAKAIDAAEPKVLIWEDPTYRDPGKAPAELFELCDVLCPNRPMWLAQGEPFAQFYLDQRRRGRELQLYSCSGPARLLDPYSYYRLQSWHCWQIGATGSFFWALADNSGASSWNPYLAKAGPYTPLFLDEKAVTAGKHMEAIRQSVQDYEYLVMLRTAVERAKAAGRSDAAAAEAEELLNTAAAEVLDAKGADRLRWHDPKDRTIADKVRVRILEALAMLRER